MPFILAALRLVRSAATLLPSGRSESVIDQKGNES